MVSEGKNILGSTFSADEMYRGQKVLDERPDHYIHVPINFTSKLYNFVHVIYAHILHIYHVFRQSNYRDPSILFRLVNDSQNIPTTANSSIDRSSVEGTDGQRAPSTGSGGGDYELSNSMRQESSTIVSAPSVRVLVLCVVSL